MESQIKQCIFPVVVFIIIISLGQWLDALLLLTCIYLIYK